VFELIINQRCQDCTKQTICKWYNVLEKFNPEKKNYIDIDLEFVRCSEFEEVKIKE